MTATKTLRDMFISGYVTLCNDPCNLCRNSLTRLRDKLQGKLPSVTVPLYFQVTFSLALASASPLLKFPNVTILVD